MRNHRNMIAAAMILAGALGAVLLLARTGQTQQTPSQMTVGIYAPTVEFGTAQQRLQYVQGLAKAIEGATGIRTVAQSYASFGALKKANVDFAIVDGQCYAASSNWRLLANAQVGSGTSRTWALYSSIGGEMQGLRGKKLAYVQTGCNDGAFIDNAMLESEVDSSFFSSRVDKPDLTAAVAEVASYKGAQAVFAPVGSAKGLTKVFETMAVPNPAFVQVNGKLPSSVSSKVATAVTGYGGGGAISAWSSPSKSAYNNLAEAMRKRVKRGVFAGPEPVRFDAKDVLVEPATLDEPAWADVERDFARPTDRL